MNNRNFKRGDVLWVDFGETVGSVQKGLRPALVIGNDKGSHYSPVLVVAPITSKQKKNIPTHLELGKECGLKADSIALMEQPMTIDKSQVIDVIGYKQLNKTVDIKINISLGCLYFLGDTFRKIVCL